MTSDKQLAANRLNAQKSTGPKTDQGKAVSKYNALRHGLLSQEVVLPGEDESAFDELYEKFREELLPEGELEIQLVERIATLCWRLRRIGKVEAGIFEMQRSESYLQRVKSAAEKRLKRIIPIGDQESWEASRDERSYQESLLRVDDAEKSRQEDLLTVGLAFVKDSREINAFSKLSRYETGIERSLYRAIQELERLQAKRQVNQITTPMIVDVTDV